MAKPKEHGTNPLKVTIQFVKKAGMWCYHEAFNTENVADYLQWFDTKEQAQQHSKERGHSVY